MLAGDLSQLAREILAYLVEHPRAQDTLEGIMEWWLLERDLAEQAAKVRLVLEELVEQQLLEELAGLDRRVRYRLNAARSEEIMALMTDAATGGGEKGQ
jgi:hypothetical protein